MKKDSMWFYFIILVFGVLLGGQSIRWIHSQAEFGNRWVNARYRLAMEAFRKMEGASVFVLGTSEVESGFDPATFDRNVGREKDPVKSYNFGFRNMSPQDLEPLIGEMEFSRSPHLSMEAIYIKFSPTDLTEASEKSTVALNDEVAANILSRKFLIQTIRAEPLEKLKILGIKEFQGGYSSTNLNVSLRSIYLQLLSAVTGRDFLVSHPLDSPRYQLWASAKFNAEPAWDLSTQGYHDRSVGGLGVEAENLYRVQALSDYLKYNFFAHERRSQMTSLRFSPHMVATFQEQLGNLRRLSKNVVMFYVPDHPALPRSAEALAETDQVFRSLCEGSQVRCIRFDKKAEFTARDYYDACHLNPAAVERLSVLLAEDFKTLSAL